MWINSYCFCRQTGCYHIPSIYEGPDFNRFDPTTEGILVSPFLPFIFFITRQQTFFRSAISLKCETYFQRMLILYQNVISLSLVCTIPLKNIRCFGKMDERILYPNFECNYKFIATLQVKLSLLYRHSQFPKNTARRQMEKFPNITCAMTRAFALS